MTYGSVVSLLSFSILGIFGLAFLSLFAVRCLLLILSYVNTYSLGQCLGQLVPLACQNCIMIQNFIFSSSSVMAVSKPLAISPILAILVSKDSCCLQVLNINDLRLLLSFHNFDPGTHATLHSYKLPACGSISATVAFERSTISRILFVTRIRICKWPARLPCRGIKDTIITIC